LVICEKIVEVRRKSDIVMVMVMAFGEEVVRMVFAYGPQIGRIIEEKRRFYDELASEWDHRSPGEMVLGLRDFNGHVGKHIDGFENVHGGNGIGERNAKGRMLPEFCDEKELCVVNTWYQNKKRK